MTAQHDDVSGLVDQTFNLHLQHQDLKRQVFHVSDDLDMLYHAYEGLQVITGNCGVDAENVCAVLHGLNCRFEYLLARLHAVHAQPEPDAR